jgi:hypothetical protein
LLSGAVVALGLASGAVELAEAEDAPPELRLAEREAEALGLWLAEESPACRLPKVELDEDEELDVAKSASRHFSALGR